MMKALSTLVHATSNKNVGNHAVRREGVRRSFSYHGNIICVTDDTHRRVYLTHAGWYTSSTTRAINDYRRFFVVGCGYEEVQNI